MKKGLGLALIFICCLWCLDVAGAKDSSFITLPEVVVTESRIEETKKDVTTHVTVISEEEIQLSSARDLGELLTERGLSIIKYPGALSSVQLRGFRTDATGNDLLSRVLILIDGRRASTGNLSKILTQNIERVEIISGPASVQYGAAAMGGVINVITKKGKGRPSWFLEGKYGSFGFKEASIGGAGKYQGFDFSGTLSTNSMDDYKVPKGITYENTGYDRIDNVSLNLGYEILPRNRLGLIYHYYNGKHLGTAEYLTNNDLDDYADKKTYSWDMNYQGETEGGRFKWFLRFFDGEDKNTWTDPTGSDPSGFDDGIPTISTIKQKGAQAQFTSVFKIVTASLGVDWVSYNVENTWDPKESEYKNPAYFLLLKSKFFDEKLILSGGIRYDKFDVEVKQGQGGKESSDKTSPRLGLALNIVEGLKVRANYGEAFKMPEAMQLAGNIPMWGVTYKGNPSLKPEKSTTYEAGFDIFKGAFDGSITFFSTRLRDKIQQTQVGPTIVSFQNLGSATLRGFEGNLSYDLGSLLDLAYEIRPYFRFTRMSTYKDNLTNKTLFYTPDWTLSYGLNFSYGMDLSFNLNLSYIGRQKVEDWESGIWPVPEIDKGGFTVANMTIRKKVLDFKELGNLTLIGEVQNLFDTEYAYQKGYPMPRRGFYLGMRYQF